MTGSRGWNRCHSGSGTGQLLSPVPVLPFNGVLAPVNITPKKKWNQLKKPRTLLGLPSYSAAGSASGINGKTCEYGPLVPFEGTDWFRILWNRSRSGTGHYIWLHSRKNNAPTQQEARSQINPHEHSHASRTSSGASVAVLHCAHDHTARLDSDKPYTDNLRNERRIRHGYQTQTS
jgi:hypothetical protein